MKLCYLLIISRIVILQNETVAANTIFTETIKIENVKILRYWDSKLSIVFKGYTIKQNDLCLPIISFTGISATCPFDWISAYRRTRIWF
jgi:hypothetical protein